MDIPADAVALGALPALPPGTVAEGVDVIFRLRRAGAAGASIRRAVVVEAFAFSYTAPLRRCSSVGRATDSLSVGRRFDSSQRHQFATLINIAALTSLCRHRLHPSVLAGRPCMRD